MRRFLMVGAIAICVALYPSATTLIMALFPQAFSLQLTSIETDKSLSFSQMALKRSELMAGLPANLNPDGAVGNLATIMLIVGFGVTGAGLLIKSLRMKDEPPGLSLSETLANATTDMEGATVLSGEPTVERKPMRTGLFGVARRTKREAKDRIPQKAKAGAPLIQAVVKSKPAHIDKAKEFPSDPTPAPTPGVDTVEMDVPFQVAPTTQAQVDAIPENMRGASFFSGRPTKSDRLVEICVCVGGANRDIYATEDEAEAVAHGKLLMVRAFTENNVTLPWYDFERYVPYRDYVALDRLGWEGFNDTVKACFMRLENVDPRLHGYYDEDLE